MRSVSCLSTLQQISMFIQVVPTKRSWFNNIVYYWFSISSLSIHQPFNRRNYHCSLPLYDHYHNRQQSLESVWNRNNSVSNNSCGCSCSRSIGVQQFTAVNSFSIVHHQRPRYSSFTPRQRRFIQIKKENRMTSSTTSACITDDTKMNTSHTQHSNTVLVIGSANYDITTYTSTIPKAGETVIARTEQPLGLSCGGKGANQAKTIACILQSISSLPSTNMSTTVRTTALVAPTRVHMVCRVGDDIFGHEILRNFQQYHIQYDTHKTMIRNDPDCTAATTTTSESSTERNTDHTNINDPTESVIRRTGVASIIVDTLNDGENQIIVTPGANDALRSIDVQTAIRQYQPNIALLQLEIPLETVNEAITVLRQQQQQQSNETVNNEAFIIVNPAPVPNYDFERLQEWKQKYLHMIDILIPNEMELRQLCKDSHNDTDAQNSTHVEQLALSLLHTYSIRRAVIVTLGSRGACVVERTHHNIATDLTNLYPSNTSAATTTTSTTYVQAPLEIMNHVKNQNLAIIDTVGAGDAFCGAFTAYLSSMMTATTSATGNNDTVNNHSYADLATLACGYATMTIYQRGTNYPRGNDIPPCLRIDSLQLPVSSGLIQVPPQVRAPVPPSTKVLTFVTGNAKKLEEVRQILGTSDSNSDFPYTVINQKIDLPELQGDDVYEIAKEKCRIAAQIIQGPCFIEDTSLCFNALNGLPGPYIKWFLEKCGHVGLNQMLSGFEDNTAYAQTIVAYTDGKTDDAIFVFDGRTNGTIVQPRGNLDFGWDPIFEPTEGNGLTYAEMEKSTKNVISHRGRSFAKFQSFLMDPNNQNR
jgi:inosine triphosphate pyrophosphatase